MKTQEGDELKTALWTQCSHLEYQDILFGLFNSTSQFLPRRRYGPSKAKAQMDQRRYYLFASPPLMQITIENSGLIRSDFKHRSLIP